MAQLTVLLSSTDTEFRAHVTKCLRASGVSVALVDERHATANPPSLAVVDIRHGSEGGVEAIERLRGVVAVGLDLRDCLDGGARSDSAGDARRRERIPRLVGRIDAARSVSRRPAADRGARHAEGRHAHSAVLSFFGVKGGAGTTTLAVNSAIEIARMSKRPTLIIDLHQFLGEVSLFLGVRPRFTLVDALDNLHRIDSGVPARARGEAQVRARHSGRRRSDRSPRPAGRRSTSSSCCRSWDARYDFIIIDAGMVTGPCADVAVFAADTIYLVANPDIASVRNAHRLVDRFEQLGAGKDRLRMLLNRMSDQHEIGPKQIETHARRTACT